jgi:hypothetical protein
VKAIEDGLRTRAWPAAAAREDGMDQNKLPPPGNAPFADALILDL